VGGTGMPREDEGSIHMAFHEAKYPGSRHVGPDRQICASCLPQQTTPLQLCSALAGSSSPNSGAHQWDPRYPDAAHAVHLLKIKT
jgi:hypothetical protein